MYVTDLKREFYDVIRRQSVLVLVSFDVDAVCAWKILQFLFKCDHVTYTLIPVNGIDDLKNAFTNNMEIIKHIILINCAASFNLLELLQAPEDVMFYVIDSHRPLDIYNFYNNGQVKLILNSTEDVNSIPAFQDLFSIDDSDEEEDDENVIGSDSDESPPKKRRFDEEVLEKRFRRREWEKKRDEILDDYLHLTYYGPSSAVLLFDLAWKMSKDNNEILWWAIVGLTEQFLNFKIDSETYTLECGDLQNHVARLNPRHEMKTKSIDCVKIVFDKELGLALYRHWSLYKSIRHTMHTVCKFKLWTLRGEKKLHEFLADLGLPLVQVRQNFVSMDMLLRRNVIAWIEEKAEKYGLNQIIFGSFHMQHGFRNKFCASDIVYALTAFLEVADDNKVPAECFYDAVDSLARSRVELLYTGLGLAKQQLEVIYRQVQSFINSGQVIPLGPFLYAIIQEGTLNVRYFSYAHCLSSLAHFLLRSQIASARNKKIHSLPLILSAPTIEDESICILVGIPPAATNLNLTKNFFGKAFERASETCKCEISMANFDTNVILIRREDRSRFLDSLISVLS